MKNLFKKIISLILIITLVLVLNPDTTFAASDLISDANKINLSSITEENLISKSITNYTLSGSNVTKTVSVYEGNVTVVETLTTKTLYNNVNKSTSSAAGVSAASTSGTTTATKDKTITGDNTTIFYGSITATFTWDSQTSECISVSTSKSYSPNYTLSEWTTSRGHIYFLGIKTGSSYGQVDYYLYMTAFPAAYHDGYICITCSKNGGIS